MDIFEIPVCNVRFSICFEDEYLTSLREKHNNVCANQNSYELKSGELVLLKIAELPRDQWPLGKITQVTSSLLP